MYVLLLRWHFYISFLLMGVGCYSQVLLGRRHTAVVGVGVL